MYAFTSDLGQENCLQLVHDDDDNIHGDNGRTCDTAEMDDGPGDDLSWSDDDELQDRAIGDVDCDSHSDDSDEDQYLVNTMYNLDPHEQDESSWDKEYYEF